jgi:hypothetical protein
MNRCSNRSRSRSNCCLLGLILTLGSLSHCTPLAVQVPSQESQQDRLDKERFQARIRSLPGAPQAISGFLRIGRAYSTTMGSAAVVSRVGNPRDLDMILDTVNEYTEINAEFAPDLPYSDPRLLDLPIIVPQSKPNEVELEQLTVYIMAGGFVLDTGLGFDLYREGLEKYGGLVWGQDAWVEVLQDDHPLFSSFFQLGSVGPTGGQAPPGVLMVNGRVAVLGFETLGKRDVVQRQEVLSSGRPKPVSAETRMQGLSPELTEELDALRVDRFTDFRFEQMVVNVVVFALTQEGSIVARQPR